MIRCSQARAAGYWFGVFAFFCSVSYLRFHRWLPECLWGDDLILHLWSTGQYQHDPQMVSLMDFVSAKFRPVYNELLHLQALSFGKSMTGYHIVTVAISGLGGALAFALFARLSGSKFAGLVLSAILTTSSLALYQSTLVTGQVESLPFVLMLGAVLLVLNGLDTNRNGYWWGAMTAAALACHAHERYLALVIWVVIAALISGISKRGKLSLLGAGAAVLLVNALLKKLILHATYFEGTGGQPMHISSSSIATLSMEAVRSIFGINTGPEFLSGVQWHNMSEPGRLAGIGFAALTCVFLLVAVVQRGADARKISLFAVLGIGLLVPAVLLVRMEQRWELSSFAMLLALIAIGVRRSMASDRARMAAIAALALFAGCFGVSQYILLQSIDSVVFVSAQKFSTNVKTEIIDSPTAPRGNLAFIADDGYCHWAMVFGTQFFRFYGVDDTSATCFPDIQSAAASSRKIDGTFTLSHETQALTRE